MSAACATVVSEWGDTSAATFAATLLSERMSIQTSYTTRTDMCKPVGRYFMSDPVRHAPKVVGMHIPDEIINQATATALREVMVGSHFKQESWAAAAGMSYVTVQKLLSGKQSVKVPQLLALARASNFTPEEVMERINRAVQRAVSDAASNVTEIRPNQSPKGGAQEDFDGQARAAHRDAELELDEPDAP